MIVDRIDHAGRTLAIILSGPKTTDGIEFVGAPDDPLQVGVMSWGAGHHIAAHYHPPAYRTLIRSAELILVRWGSVEARFYADPGPYPLIFVTSRTLDAGDAVLLLDGGHEFIAGPDGFEAVECKTGPYLGDRDKIRFDPKELLGQLDCS